MTKEEIMKMAREAGINFRPLDDDYCDMVGLDRGTICRVESIGDEEIKRFATMVAAAEREACVKACKAQKQLLGEDEAKIGGLGIAMCIDAISTRGQK